MFGVGLTDRPLEPLQGKTMKSFVAAYCLASLAAFLLIFHVI